MMPTIPLSFFHHPENRAAAGIPDQIHPFTVPMIVEMPALDRAGGTVGVEEPDTFSPSLPYARIGYPIRTSLAQGSPQQLGGRIILRIEASSERIALAAQIVKVGANRQDDFPKLGCPTGSFGRARHEPGVMMDRLE